MGLENRGYMQDEPSFFGGRYSGSADQLITIIIAINVVVFIVQNMGMAGGAVTQWLMLSQDTLLQGQIWRVVTYGFCHAGIFHIFFNMINLFFFGRMLSQAMRQGEFLAFYLTAIVVGGLTQIVWNLGDAAIIVGASAGVSGLLLLAAMRYPRMQVHIMGIFPLELRWLAIIFFIFSFAYVGSRGPTAHAAHLGGALFGIAYQYFQWNLTGMFTRSSSDGETRWKNPFRRKPKLKIHNPTETRAARKQQELKDEVDRILAKIHEEGEASLTNKERKTLEKASKQYRQLNK